MLIGAKENTREGFSLRYAGNYMKRTRDSGHFGDPHSVKLLILAISDGEPVHEAGGLTLKGKMAQEDAKEAVKELERNGITVVGVAIGDTPSAISRIYNRSVDIAALDQLPKRLLMQIMLAKGLTI
jgi:nitric oxide reductase activation protein